MQIEYSWLTSALLSRRDYFGSAEGLPLPFLLRHGVCSLRRRPDRGLITLNDWAETVRTGGCEFYLAATSAGGVPLELADTLFLVDRPPHSIVVGPQLLEQLASTCDLDRGHCISIDDSVSVHEWTYELPPREDLTLYQRVLEAIEAEELPGDHEIMKGLCLRYPASVEVPPMHVILAPSLLDAAGVGRRRRGERITLLLGSGRLARTREGDEPVTANWLSTRPMIGYDGFLIPRDAASLFGLGREEDWPNLAFVKDVVLRQ